MKRCWLIIILLFSMKAPGPLLAQEGVDIFGYFESQLTGANLKEGFIQLQSNKLRVDMEGALTEKVTFAANFDYITYHGMTEWDLLDLLPERVSAQASPFLIPYYRMAFNNRHFLDNAFLKLTFKHFNITAGKQQISPGTGYAWNPTDLFNTKDILDPTYEQPGHNALRLYLPLGARSSLTAIYSPADIWEHSAKVLEIKTGISRFDFTFMAVEKEWLYHDYRIPQSSDQGMGFSEMFQRRSMAGFCSAGELLGLGVWAECAYNFMEKSDNFYGILTGADYTFDSQTYLMCEYLRNSRGKSRPEEYTINDWMRFLTSEQKTLARDQLYGMIRHPVTDLIDLGLSSIYTISDHSTALIPTLNWSIFQDVEITAYLYIYIGDADSAWNPDIGNGGILRARVHF